MSQPDKFWSWFERHELKFRSVEMPEQEELLDELLEQLHDYCPHLWFETGRADDGCNELIVSAEGNTNYFCSVRTLIAVAPEIRGWRFIAFKPGNGFGFSTCYEGITFNPKTTWFRPLVSEGHPSRFGIRVGYSHYDSAYEQAFQTGTLIMLECALGELILAEYVQHIEVVTLPSCPVSEGYFLLPEITSWIPERYC